MNRVLTVDVGNSRITFGCFEDDELVFIESLETRRKWAEQAMVLEIRRLLAKHHLTPADIDGVIQSSVVPDIDALLDASFTKIMGRHPFLMNTGLKTGIGTKLYDTSNFGEDRLADMAAAITFYGTPVAVYDLGTCTTLSVTDADANFIGGMISAGVQLGLDVQAERTAALPQLTAGEAWHLLGRDTVSNMISGAVAGTGIMMDGVIDRIRADYDLPDLKVVVTGGNGKYVLPWMKNKVIYDRDLLLKGLLAIYRKNA